MILYTTEKLKPFIELNNKMLFVLFLLFLLVSFLVDIASVHKYTAMYTEICSIHVSRHGSIKITLQQL